MGALYQDFQIKQGTHERLVITVYGEDVNLTKSQLAWIVTNQDEIMITKNLEVGITVLDNTRFALMLTPDDIKGLRTDQEYLHECKMMDENNEVTTIFEGVMTVKESKMPTSAFKGTVQTPTVPTDTGNYDGGDFTTTVWDSVLDGGS